MKAIIYVLSGEVESCLLLHVKQLEVTDSSRSAAHGFLGVTSAVQSQQSTGIFTQGMSP